ncbi:peptidase [Streptomyces sp. WAC05374]|uniref:Clp protease N-terminal domain-containing protein n=1 Tax=Streptomyces sp. WAC05374 TaxID=2487420 RepID=UPI000F877147|nr:Clp protease N-terminal domain-containing protein [Streptomyces sp. WAC05374]RST18474.1 peptidase [Streptomyces sp. WAC05374]TDF43075.1 peptidase [Streptomyces sp. WAC05374]TDF46730.1 peptidase [Streptomyces sp. WAC05374]TDF49011.1 peptidase [Streptomyces sp. WAC05374]
MFERFTEAARAVVKGAATHAERLDADSVTDEHLLLALLDLEGTRSADAFAALGITGRRASVESALADARRRGGLTRADADALADIGIDVMAIVSKVEAVHGAGALAGDRRPRRRWSNHRPFTRPAKDTLEKSLRVALGRGDRHIGDEHLLLALAARPGVVADVLADHGATYGALERAVTARRAG